jgi:hypothetical protein
VHRSVFSRRSFAADADNFRFDDDFAADFVTTDFFTRDS